MADRHSPRTNALGSSSPDSVRHQQFVLADPVAFSYLEEDTSVVVLERGRYLEGYQCYVVEQWACSRSHPTFVVIAYTGDPANKVKVGVLSVPADEASWSPRLKVYFRILAQDHARRRDTPLGTVLVTNLSVFPSSLTLIHVPDGDVRKHREDFVVNENLKRLGCSGRVGISIAPPTPAAEAKFHQLYRTSEKVELYKSVIELVKVCQAALMLFSILKPEYADGLLCDVTEKAVNDWWNDFGYDYYKTEPSDGILGPTTVAGLLGMLIGARNRLNVLSAPVSKDVFDIEATKRGINHFQKTQRLHKTRRFDRQTLDSLHKATAKQASTEGWMVPRAVKSTVAELSGKGGEMVMDIVGRERATLAEVETADIERFSQLVRGERAKWLWQGRARRRTTRDMFDEHPGQVTEKVDEDLGLASSPVAERQMDPQAYEDYQRRRAIQKHAQSPTKNSADPRKTVLTRAKGRLRGATLGKKAQQHGSPQDVLSSEAANQSYESFESAGSIPLSPADTMFDKPDNIFDERARDAQHFHSPQKRDSNRFRDMAPRLTNNLINKQPDDQHPSGSPDDASQQQLAELVDLERLDQHAREAVRAEVAVAEETGIETDIEDLSPDQRPAQRVGAFMLRTGSYSRYVEDALEKHNSHRWPRHMSFGDAQAATSGSTGQPFEDDTASTQRGDRPEEQSEPTSPIADKGEINLASAPRDAMVDEKMAELRQKALREELALLGRTTGSWLLSQINKISLLDSTAAQDAEQMQYLFAPRKEEQRALAAASQEVLKEEQARLADALRDLETLGQRVEYEIEGLRGKVEDMENSVGDFERQILFVEDRVKELVKGQETVPKSRKDIEGTRPVEGWHQWLRSVFMGAAYQGDVKGAVTEAIKSTEIKAKTALNEAVKSSPLTDAPSSLQISAQGNPPERESMTDASGFLSPSV